jgi:hypothetical protein
MKGVQLTLFAEAHLVSLSPSQDCEKDSAMTEAILLSRFAEWLSACDPNTSSGKTSQDVCHLMKDGTLAPSQGRWLNSGMCLDGVCLTQNTLESPKDDVESFLLDVLQDSQSISDKYCLSQKAAEGILRRAKRRGKTLPETLDTALRSLISNELGSTEPRA